MDQLAVIVTIGLNLFCFFMGRSIDKHAIGLRFYKYMAEMYNFRVPERRDVEHAVAFALKEKSMIWDKDEVNETVERRTQENLLWLAR